jgi:long-chain acyl-CoA synthetase
VTSEAARQRAELEGTIRGETVCDALRRTAADLADDPALSDRTGDGWHTLTWAQTRQQVLELAAGFIALGLAPGERVALMLPNRSEHLLADLGAVHAGGVPVTFYAALAAEQVGFAAGDCVARIARTTRSPCCTPRAPPATPRGC